MKFILLNLIALSAIYNTEALLKEHAKNRFPYDDGGKIQKHCERNCEDPVENVVETNPNSHIQKIPLVNREKQENCGKYKGIQDCVDKLHEAWVHNTKKMRVDYCKKAFTSGDEARLQRCHKKLTGPALALILTKTPNVIWEKREKKGEDTTELIQ